MTLSRNSDKQKDSMRPPTIIRQHGATDLNLAQLRKAVLKQIQSLASYKPNDCTKVSDPAARQLIVSQANLCFNCLYNHRVSRCK